MLKLFRRARSRAFILARLEVKLLGHRAVLLGKPQALPNLINSFSGTYANGLIPMILPPKKDTFGSIVCSRP